MMKTGLWALLLCLATIPSSWAASRTENNVFKAATKAFSDGIWARAERELGDFVQDYPKSNRRAEAVLLQGQARCKLGDYPGAIQLLKAEQSAAGPWADQYLLWLGEAHYQTSNYQAAAELYQKLANDFPASKFRLEASVGEAASWAGLGRWDRVAALLSEPTGAFQQFSQSTAARELIARGVLLLAEARLVQGDFASAEQTARQLEVGGLKPALVWQREFLLCRALLGRGQSEAALLCSSNLVALANVSAQPLLQAQSYVLQAEALETLGRLENASAIYELNCNTNAPVELQRQALFKIGELALVRGRLAEAAQALTNYLERHPPGPAGDMALLALGEIQLRQHLAAVANSPTNGPTTNPLHQAQANFTALLERFPHSALTGKAQLNRGWCLALATNLTDSAAAFAAAADALPVSWDQAVARFKLADSQYQQGQFAAAISNYSAVVVHGETTPEVKTNLCEPALYQIVRASIEITNKAAAEAAADRLLEWFPESYVTESGLLFAGQGWARQGDAAKARSVFESLLLRFPNSSREAQVRLAIARTHELQRDWTGAAQAYQTWLAKFAAHPERPRAEYALAFASYQAQDETNALAQFSRFVNEFPTNTLAPLAQWWRADYFFNRGDFAEAEKDYQLLFRTWPASDLAYEARMMAGRAAMARQSWSDAIGYFTNLTSDLNCPVDLKVRALFAYGDALRRAPVTDTNQPLANFEEARRVFAKVHDLNATNTAAARAWGEIGDCWLQLATQDARHYAAASNAFQQAVDAPSADVATRSQALIGLGLVAERLAERADPSNATALLQQAQGYYLDVFYEKLLRPDERSDLFWLRRAGLDAERLAEMLQQWPQAVRLCERLGELLPPLKPALDRKIEKLREHSPR